MEGSGVFLALVGVRGSRDLRRGVRFSLLLLEPEVRRDTVEPLCLSGDDDETLRGLGVGLGDLTVVLVDGIEAGGECGRVE